MTSTVHPEASDRTAAERSADLIVIGSGAAGIATAIFTARAAPSLRVMCLDGARRIGAKILVSGGSRCNVTNRVVTERDFWGGSRRFVRNVLRAFPDVHAIAFFTDLGVALHDEDDGKLFPDSNSSRTVLNALLSEIDRLGIAVATGERVTALERRGDSFVTTTASGQMFGSRAVAICTGGKSLPKTGSDGFGYELARRLGHGCISPIPALAPLVFGSAGADLEVGPYEGKVGPYEGLAGVSHAAAMTLRADEQPAITLEGSLLWTHFGASGPLALNMSRHWHRADEEGRGPAVTVNVCPGETFESLDAWLRDQAQDRPRARVATIVGAHLPNAIAERWTAAAGIPDDLTMAHLTRERRHALTRALLESHLPIRGSRGFGYAEVTAGGVPLEEVDSATMESRMCRNLFFSGEVLDVDGRLGGFNFQWAWSSAWVAGQAIARRLSRS